MKSSRLACCFLLAAAAAQASLITTPPAGTTTVLTTLTGTYSEGLSVVAAGYTISSNSDVWYGDSSYGLSNNGSWSDFAWVGGVCADSGCTATIALGGLFSSVGGFMNYADPPEYGDPIISAIAADGTTVLESYDLATDAPILTPGASNDGAFRGISRPTADIAFFQISGSYLIQHDLTLSSNESAAPEPATMGMAGLALVTIAFLRRRPALKK